METTGQQGPAAIVLFYEPSTGDVVHGHYHEVEPGSDLPDRTALEKLATEHARRYANKRKHLDLDKLLIHHVDARNFHMDRMYKVDTKTNHLLEISKPAS